ncbi:MAG: hypothetical protein RBT59_13590 [Arcobacteraceae bacterium]|nr:hypothetical protein [Arcobacteraceae bacterium]
MSKRIDLTNKTFGKLTIIKFVKNKNTHAIWEAECSCSKKIEVQSGNLISGNTRSCQSCGNTTHGKSKDVLYRRWEALKNRESLSNEWKDCSAFIKDVGSTYKEGYTLRRINTQKPHSFDNSYWAEPRKGGRTLSKRICFAQKKEALEND